MTRGALPYQVRAAHLPEPQPEFRFHAQRRWRFDLAWPDCRVAVEVDGATFAGGRHVTGTGYERDAEKLNEATVLGWRVLRVTPAMIDDGRALGWLERLLGGHDD